MLASTTHSRPPCAELSRDITFAAAACEAEVIDEIRRLAEEGTYETVTISLTAHNGVLSAEFVRAVKRQYKRRT